MKFKGEPGMYVIDSVTGKQIGRFDEKGYLDIEDDKTAVRMKNSFTSVQEKQKSAAAPKGKEVK